MADFAATTPNIPTLFASADAVPASTPLAVPTSNARFLMRGYRPGSGDFETWVAVGSPNSDNPSGLPIVDVTVQARW